jgi:hypothetical protein
MGFENPNALMLPAISAICASLCVRALRADGMSRATESAGPRPSLATHNRKWQIHVDYGTRQGRRRQFNAFSRGKIATESRLLGNGGGGSVRLKSKIATRYQSIMNPLLFLPPNLPAN